MAPETNGSIPEHGPQPRGTADAAPAALSMTDRAIGWEVAAVLAIAVLPPLSAAIVSSVQRPDKLPYWLDSLDLCSHSACVSFAVLYVMHRSGEPWSSFGVTRPRLSDPWLGLLLFLVTHVLWVRLSLVLPAGRVKPDAFFPVPRGATDYALMMLKHAANGFAEELVMRAYLITRLERLLKSRLGAVTLSAVLFASYHLYQGPGGLIYMLLLGLTYGGCYLLLRRVWPLALGHMFVNVYIDFDGSLN